MKSFRLFCALLSLFAPLSGWAQGEFTTWCFGYNLVPTTPTSGSGLIKIVFGPIGPQPSTAWRGAHNLAFYWGNATISDATGNLRLSSDGFNIEDNTPATMLPFPFGLNGAINTNNDFWWDNQQSVAIAPAPGNDHEEYVFFWEKAQADGRLAFALGWVRVDMRLNGGHGAVAGRG